MLIPFSRRFRTRYPWFARTFGLTASFLVSFGAGFAYASWAMVCRAGRCPSANALRDYEPRQTSKILAADGRLIAELGLEKRTLVKLQDIPPIVRDAFLTIEDKRFYKHSGIDWVRVPGALLTDIKNRNFSEGFSTLTMQLARNIFPERISREKSLVRKLKEQGCEIWAVSSTSEWVIREAMTYFDIPAAKILAVAVEIENGHLTDKLIRIPSGPGKATAIREVVLRTPDASFGNSRWDTEMLALAKHPFAVNPNPDLEKVAKERGWTLYFPDSVRR